MCVVLVLGFQADDTDFWPVGVFALPFWLGLLLWGIALITGMLKVVRRFWMGLRHIHAGGMRTRQ